ncbi:MAG: SDR family oxidoreductase [Pleurocapsa sp. SU_196_0]|nr:SDR family oxidoreductase [Pleurocapsa sp. SU_196_0]
MHSCARGRGCRNTRPSTCKSRRAVTDAGRGLSRAIAQQLALGGVNVALVGYTARGLETTLARLGTGARSYRANLTKETDVDELLRQVSTEQGAPEMLVNVLPMGGESASPWTESVETWWDTVRINLRGAFLTVEPCCQACSSVDAARSSTSAPSPKSARGALLTSSGAVNGLTAALAAETLGSGVRAYSLIADFGGSASPRAQFTDVVARRIRDLCSEDEPSGRLFALSADPLLNPNASFPVRPMSNLERHLGQREVRMH